MHCASLGMSFALNALRALAEEPSDTPAPVVRHTEHHLVFFWTCLRRNDSSQFIAARQNAARLGADMITAKQAAHGREAQEVAERRLVEARCASKRAVEPPERRAAQEDDATRRRGGGFLHAHTYVLSILPLVLTLKVPCSFQQCQLMSLFSILCGENSSIGVRPGHLAYSSFNGIIRCARCPGSTLIE